MRELNVSQITETVARLCIEAATKLPPELCDAIRAARTQERSPVGQAIFDDMIRNFELAAQTGLPICQDTGMAVVFMELGQDVHLVGGSLNAAVDEGVRIGYRDGLLRKSVVDDPLRRVNNDENTPAVLHLTIVDGEQVRITVAPKGFGSENMSAMRCFTPSATREDVEDFIRDAMSQAGSNPCPPVILGVGLGGTIEQAARLAAKLEPGAIAERLVREAAVRRGNARTDDLTCICARVCLRNSDMKVREA